MADLALEALVVPLRSFDLRLSLDVRSTVALVGPSGAGKSTVLRAVAGLTRPAEGRISSGGEVWFDAGRRVDLPPDARRVGLVFQDYALFPHMTVRQNIEYARRHRADEYLERFANLAPRGGTARRAVGRRAAAGRARAGTCTRPRRPASRRAAVGARRAHEGRTCAPGCSSSSPVSGIPVLLVTHDFEDAAALADRVGVIVDGALRQTGTPTELVAHPRDPFVAAFTGANLLRGRGESVGGTTWVRLDDGSVVATTEPARGDVVLAVYPWDIVVSTVPPNDSALNLIAAPIGSIAELGNRARVTIGPVSAEITAESLHRLGLRVGQTAFASFKATGTRVVANGRERAPRSTENR